MRSKEELIKNRRQGLLDVVIKTELSDGQSQINLETNEESINLFDKSVTMSDIIVRNQDYHFSELIQQLPYFWNEKKFMDTELICADGVVKCHKLILGAISPFLYQILANVQCEQFDFVTILLPDLKKDLVENLIKNIYIGNGKIGKSDQDFFHILEIITPIFVKDNLHNLEGDNEKSDNFKIEFPAEDCGNQKHIMTRKSSVTQQENKGSKIWKYFKKSRIGTSCLECGANVKLYKDDTSSLVMHMKESHNEEYVSHEKKVESIGDALNSDDIIYDSDNENYEFEANDPLFEPPSRQGKRNKYKSRSKIWLFFEKSTSGGKCYTCGNEIIAQRSGTTNLISHLKAHHKKEFDEFNDIKSVKEENIQKINNSKIDLLSKRTFIWQFFEQLGLNGKCLQCDELILLENGKMMKLAIHLQQKHKDIFTQYKRLCKIKVYFEKCGTNSYSCNTCKATFEFKNPASLLVHLERDHADLYEEMLIEKPKYRKKVVTDAERTCQTCGKMFTNPRVMQDHVRFVHSQIKPHWCQTCKKGFTRPDSFRSHTCIFNNIIKKICSFCGKGFNRKSACDRHERSHKNDRRYSCSFCTKKFLTQQRVVAHERTHTGECPYVCSTCGRQFKTGSQLRTHSFIHTGEKPYKCEKCNNNFRHLSSRKNHKCVSQNVSVVVANNVVNDISLPVVLVPTSSNIHILPN